MDKEIKGKRVGIYNEQGEFFSYGKIVDSKENKIYIKYLGDFERKDYGYFDFDIVIDCSKPSESKRIKIL